MKITKSNVIILKNKPMSAKERESKDEVFAGKPEEYSIFVELTGEENGEEFVGLGEARPTGASNETLSGAARYTRKMARRLVGKDVQTDAENPIGHAHDIVDDIVRDIFGIGKSSFTAQRPSPSVCFAVECALLDLMARHRDVPVAELSARPNGSGVRRNVFNDPLRNVERLQKKISKGDQVQGWLRLGTRIRGPQAATLVNSLLFALGGNSPDLEGIILNAGQRWSPDAWDSFCDKISLIDLTDKQNVSVIVEDPFPEEANAFYKRAFEKMEGLPIRIMLSKPIWGPESIKTLALYMPHVDLKIVPQKAGGYQDVLEAERAAEEEGFKGGIYLSGISGTTNLNALAMVSLAGAMNHCRYFSTTFKKEDKVRLVYPHVVLEDGELRLPEGPGFATNLCRSGLRRRLVAINGYDPEGSVGARQTRRALLESVYDDRLLHREELEE